MVESTKLRKQTIRFSHADASLSHFLCGLCDGAELIFIGGCMSGSAELIDCGKTNEKGCWVVTNQATSRNGYPRKWVSDEKRTVTISRIVWKLCYGEIPKNLCVLHKCDNPACINIDHLFLGTLAENIKDKVNKNRQAKGEKVNTAKLTEEQVIAIRNDKRTVAVIGKEYGVDGSLISFIKIGKIWKHVKEGVIRSPKSGNFKLTENQVLEIRKDPRPVKLIAKEYGINPTTACSIRNKKSWKHIKSGRVIKPRFCNSKVTVGQVIAIRNDKRGVCVIAKEYGINRQQIRNIKNRTSWKCIP
jgi:hypothetical protein